MVNNRKRKKESLAFGSWRFIFSLGEDAIRDFVSREKIMERLSSFAVIRADLSSSVLEKDISDIESEAAER